MNFTRAQRLTLPDLASHLGLPSTEFIVRDVLAGGMGQVLRIEQNNRSYALKLIRSDLIEQGEAWERYLRELRIWTTLSACEGIVEALCIIRVNEVPAICSPWMAGGSLRGYLRDRSPDTFFSVMSRIIGTLRWASQHHHIIHRDLKPDNILLDDAKSAFVSDWGIARALTKAVPGRREFHPTGKPASELTAAGEVLGTVYYASPEQLVGESAIDQATDIYSLGCMMHEWESGRCPFLGKTAEEIRLKHLFEAPPRLGSVLRRTAFGAEHLIRACLEKNPANRPHDYDDVESAISDAARQRGVLYTSYRPSLRYEMPMVGAGEYRRSFDSEKSARTPAGTYAIREYSEIEKFLREAEALFAIGDFQKAAEIYGSAFVPELVTAVPDHPLNQHATIAYANCLLSLGKSEDALKALLCMIAAKEKPAEYFVNLSLALIRQRDYQLAETTAEEGLRIYAGDPDLIGNLLTAQTALGAFERAAQTARTRLAGKRDVHALHEVAILHCRYATTIRESDWPLAVRSLKYAIELLREAKTLNPRFLPVRMQLCIALESVGAFAQCSEETAECRDLPLHRSDQVALAHLVARSLDGTGAHKQCWEFCDRWLKSIEESGANDEAARSHAIRIKRVRAATIADGFCIGMMKEGLRVAAPDVMTFFNCIVDDERHRQPEDFCYLARLHEWNEDRVRAYAILDRAEDLYPSYWEIQFNRADFLRRAGDFDSALLSADAALKVAPWRICNWRILAEIHTQLGDISQADAANAQAERVRLVREHLRAEIDQI